MIKKILITKEWIEYLEKRNLEKQFKKAKNYLLIGNYNQVNFSLREPKKDKVFYFRINGQYRAWGYIENEIFKIIKIDDHQN